MRVCLMVEGQEGVGWDDWLALGQAAERAGLDALFRSDHYRSIVRRGDAGSLDAWATLAAIGARTERIRLGTLVSPVTFRHPSVLAKNAVTVDHISGGRVEVGLGAGWFEAEHAIYGFAFPPLGQRLDELDRQLDEVVRQWTADPDVLPAPLQRPHPPLIVGGAAKPRTVRAAVRHGAEYNTTFASVEECRERRRVVERAAREAGRDPLTFSLMTGCVVGRDRAEVDERLRRLAAVAGGAGAPPLHGTVDEVVERLRAYAAVGVERVMLQHLLHEDVAMVDALGDVAAALA
jgi:alkanesulfonate monooxygenase SsuD/methylene tetrahydromethanopterin reductase-like flavin-dependent oxidoreductase (luciferase family)